MFPKWKYLETFLGIFSKWTKKNLSDFQIFPFWKHLETFLKHFATFFWDIFTKWTKIVTIPFPNISKMETFGNIFIDLKNLDKNSDYPISKCFQNGNIWKHLEIWTKIITIPFPNISILETFGNIFIHLKNLDKNSDYPISKYFHFGNFWKHLETFGNLDKNNYYPISKYFHFGNSWKLLETVGNSWKQLETVGNFWKHLETFGNLDKKIVTIPFPNISILETVGNI